MTNSSAEQFKKGLDKSFSGIELNSDTMLDLMNSKQGMKEEDTNEEWSEKYKKSIDCSHPKGFSQRAHCQGLKKKSKSETKESTGSGSVGAFSGPVFGGDEQFWEKSHKETPKLKESEVQKAETKEATGSGSVGGYSSPAMWAKSTSKKDWGPSRKTQIPGGGFVKVKKKCTKFPYCNQGDIKALNIFENETLKKVIKDVSNKYNIEEQVVRNIIEYEYNLIKDKL